MNLAGRLAKYNGMLAREEWISACAFHPLTEPEVLEEVSRRVSAASVTPLVLLDLDSTLYEVGPRTYRIIREWAESEENYSDVRGILSQIEESHVGYSIRDTLGNLALNLPESDLEPIFLSLKSFWSQRFFTNSYLAYDRPYPGAAKFARKLYSLGAQIVYLTGRDEPNMGRGTRENLIRDGFPWGGDRVHLLLKKDAHLPDLVHKKAAANLIHRHGKLVASFENEPPNLVALYEIFPDAMHVFVETICSDHKAMPVTGLYRIKGFEASG